MGCSPRLLCQKNVARPCALPTTDSPPDYPRHFGQRARSTWLMSIKLSSAVWKGSRHKSGNLLVLLAIADHADDYGRAWPGVRLLACEARLSQRHARRCLNELVVSGELRILPEPAPSGGKLYQIQLDQLTPDNLCIGTSVSHDVTSVSLIRDAGDQSTSTPYIKEPSTKSSGKPGSNIKTQNSSPQIPRGKKRLRAADSIGLISQPKNGF